MKETIRTTLRASRLAVGLGLLSALNSQLPTLFAQGTSITYQGRLVTNGVPFAGSAEFQFTLWDAVSSGNAVATNAPASLIATVDSNGVFTVAQDFHAAFGLGNSETTITSVDPDGVAFAAIQGLNQRLTEELKQKETEITELKARLEALEKSFASKH